MEDLKKRFEIENVAIQSQAAWKLFAEVLKKNSGAGIINSSTLECLELKFLWEKSGIDDNIVCLACCSALLELVYSGNADFTYILNGLLNQVPSARNLSGIIKAVGELLVFQAVVHEKSEKLYKSPFSLRNPPHPFITILVNRPDSWSLLQQEVYRICCHDNRRIQQQTVEILSPFIKFVLLEPQQAEHYQPIRSSLQRVLLQVCDQSGPRIDVFRELTELFPCFQVRNVNSFGEIVQFLSEVLSEGLHHPQTYRETMILLTTAAFDLCLLCARKKQNYGYLARRILAVGQIIPETLTCDRSLVMLTDLIPRTALEDSLTLLQIVKLILKDASVLCPMVVGMATLPVLQLLSLPKSGGQGALVRRLSVTAGEVLKMIENILHENSTTPIEKNVENEHVLLSPEGRLCQTYAELARRIHTDSTSREKWLSNLEESISGMKNISISMTNLVAAVFVHNPGQQVSKQALAILVQIAKQDTNQAPYFLPLLLYQLVQESDADMKLEVLQAVPAIATHKVTVSPILRTIQMFALSPRLQSMSLQLLTALWQQQDRCFPQLLKAITENCSKLHMSHSGVNSPLLSAAAAIRDVCQSRPEQHGADMLGPLSEILNNCTDEAGAPAAALALEGLCSLCESEVIDIRSAWSILSARLRTDSRSVVIQKVCDFFSLVPLLEVKTPEYETFTEEVVASLWNYASSENEAVCCSAYQALSAFNSDWFRITHLPSKITEDFIEQSELIIQQQDIPGVTVNDILPFVPAVCYTRLLNALPTTVYKDFENFLNAMVIREVENLPRGIYHSSLRQQRTTANQGKAIGCIPEFILDQYDNTKQPGLRPGLAASLLFCYDPPVEAGRDGRPRKHYIITHSKNYQHMFGTLLNEVPTQPSDWHRCMLTSQAWTSFVDRLYPAMLEGRKAEIELQLKRGHLLFDDGKEKLDSSWLWVRDTIVSSIKKASKGNPSMQSNAVMALSGLVVAVSRHAAGMDQDAIKSTEDLSEHKSHIHWLNIAIDTILSLMDVKYRVKGALLGLCQQITGEDRIDTSLLARASASLALAHIIPIIITVDSDRISKILSMMAAGLPGKESTGGSPILQFHMGVGLGMILARLFEERFSDVCGNKGKVEIWKMLDALEDCCLSNIDNRVGALLGLGTAVSAVCHEGNTESRAYVVAILEKLCKLYNSTDVFHSSFQALSFCLSCVAGSAFVSNILLTDDVMVITKQILQTHQQHPDNTGSCLSLGMLCYSLGKMGHHAIGDLRRKLFVDWMKTITSEETAPMQRVATLNGIMALVGSERTLISVQGGTLLMGSDVNVDDVIKMSIKILNTGSDLGIQSNSAWMLGHLYLSACAVSETRATVPPTYSYLAESSILRALVDFLIEAGKRGPEFISSDKMKTVLSALQEDIKQVLPPVNWAGILSPLMRLDFDCAVKCRSLSLSVLQCSSAPTAVMFLSSWVTPPLFNTLPEECKIILYDSLPLLIKSVGTGVIRTLLERECREPFAKPDTCRKQCFHILMGLNKALQVHNPPDSITAALYQATEVLYTLVNSNAKCDILSTMSECLGNVPDQLFDRITQKDFTDTENFIKGAYVCCYLVANGKQPITLLNGLVDATMNSSSVSERRHVYTLLQYCFHRTSCITDEMTGVLCRMQWFLELLGHSRNLATGVCPLSNQKADLKEAVKFSVQVVAAACCAWTSLSSACVFGLNTSCLTCPSIESPTDHTLDTLSADIVDPVKYLTVCAIHLQREPWCQVLAKFVDWLMTLLQLGPEILDSHLKKCLEECLVSLRHSDDFRKVTVWTQAYALLI